MLRHRLTYWLDRIGVADSLRRSRRAGDDLTILTFHRVTNLTRDYRFDAGVVDATPEGFDVQLAWLVRNCTVIGLDVLRERVLNDAPLPPNAVMLTFDDGYLDNYTEALPILKKHGLPATFFITTQFIEHRHLFWWDRVSFALSNSRVDELVLDYPVPLRFRLPDEAAVAHATVGALIKELHGLDLERLLDAVDEAALGMADRALEVELADELLMTWDQVRELHDNGMFVQSHTRWHRPMHTIPPERLADELAGSRRDLEERIEGAEVFALAYPVGRDVSALTSITRAIRDAGYELAFTNKTGSASLRRHDPLYIPRVAVEPSDPDWHLRALLSVPGLADGMR